MSKIGLSEIGLGLDELVRHGARQEIQQAIEAELQALLERFENVKTLHGRRAVVRNGYLPEREVLTAAGPVRSRSCEGDTGRTQQIQRQWARTRQLSTGHKPTAFAGRAVSRMHSRSEGARRWPEELVPSPLRSAV